MSDTPASPKDVVETYWEAHFQRDWDAMAACYSPTRPAALPCRR